MSKKVSKIQEYEDVNFDQFHNEVVPLNAPVVLRSAISHWPIVEAANKSVDHAVEYLKSMDQKQPLYTIVGEPNIGGRFFYRDDLRGVNFQRTQAPLSTVLDQLLALKSQPNSYAIAIQAASVREALPQFELENSLHLLDSSVAPTMWLGNEALVAPHYDVHDNVACVVAGRRKFTLFPPEQIKNLYVGPTLDAPGGVPISMVDLKNPDFAKFPKFEEALTKAKEATLEPGDALFIPSPWWHAVESLAPINVLINYWWDGVQDSALSPNHSLLHGMLTIAKLNAKQRESWRHFFDYFVFQTEGDPSSHLPPDLNDIVTELSPEQRTAVYTLLRERLK